MKKSYQGIGIGSLFIALGLYRAFAKEGGMNWFGWILAAYGAFRVVQGILLLNKENNSNN
jgi:hypothetical protein